MVALDMTNLRKRLTVAEHHIVSDVRVVARQRQLIVELEAHGRDTKEALLLLARSKDSLALHLADHDRLINELKSAQP